MVHADWRENLVRVFIVAAFGFLLAIVLSAAF